MSKVNLYEMIFIFIYFKVGRVTNTRSQSGTIKKLQNLNLNQESEEEEEELGVPVIQKIKPEQQDEEFEGNMILINLVNKY